MITEVALYAAGSAGIGSSAVAVVRLKKARREQSEYLVNKPWFTILQPGETVLSSTGEVVIPGEVTDRAMHSSSSYSAVYALDMSTRHIFEKNQKGNAQYMQELRDRARLSASKTRDLLAEALESNPSEGFPYDRLIDPGSLGFTDTSKIISSGITSAAKMLVIPEQDHWSQQEENLRVAAKLSGIINSASDHSVGDQRSISKARVAILASHSGPISMDRYEDIMQGLIEMTKEEVVVVAESYGLTFSREMTFPELVSMIEGYILEWLLT